LNPPDPIRPLRVLSARRGLLFAFTALVLGIAGLAWGIARLQSRSVVTEASRRIATNFEATAEDLIRDIIAPIEGRLLADVERIRLSGLPADDPDALVERFLPDLDRLAQSDSMLVADLEGRQFLLMRYEEDALRSPQFDPIRDRAPSPDDRVRMTPDGKRRLAPPRWRRR